MEQYIVTKEEINRMLLNAYWAGVMDRSLDGLIVAKKAQSNVNDLTELIIQNLDKAPDTLHS